MKETSTWVAPVESLPASLKPIAALQKKHFGAVLNPTRWWGRMPRLFWLVALFVGFLERRNARLTAGAALAADDAGIPALSLCILY